MLLLTLHIGLWKRRSSWLLGISEKKGHSNGFPLEMENGKTKNSAFNLKVLGFISIRVSVIFTSFVKRKTTSEDQSKCMSFLVCPWNFKLIFAKIRKICNLVSNHEIEHILFYLFLFTGLFTLSQILIVHLFEPYLN